MHTPSHTQVSKDCIVGLRKANCWSDNHQSEVSGLAVDILADVNATARAISVVVSKTALSRRCRFGIATKAANTKQYKIRSELTDIRGLYMHAC
jgi:hypothetical protein